MGKNSRIHRGLFGNSELFVAGYGKKRKRGSKGEQMRTACFENQEFI